MASKKSTPLDNPPSASSESSEESGSEDEQEQQETITQKSIPQQTSSSEASESDDESDEEDIPEPKIQTPVPKPPPSSESESSESGSESETEEKKPHKASIFEFESDIKSPSASDFSIKPSKNIKSFQTPENNPTLKRHISGPSGSNNNNNKKPKVESNGDTEDEKKAVIKRVWSEDDEILLLQGFIEYQSKNGYSPLTDMEGFYRFSMDKIPGNATKSQLYEKVRRLKKKFRVNVEKVGSNGEDPPFAKPHEAKIFEISKKIWGVDGCESSANFKAKPSVPKPKAPPKVKTPVKVNKVKVEEKVDEVTEDDDDEVMEDKVKDFETLYPYWNIGLNKEVSTSLKFPSGVVELVKEHFSFIGEAKAKEMDEKWKALLEDEDRLRRKRIALLNELGHVET